MRSSRSKVIMGRSWCRNGKDSFLELFLFLEGISSAGYSCLRVYNACTVIRCQDCMIKDDRLWSLFSGAVRVRRCSMRFVIS